MATQEDFAQGLSTNYSTFGQIYLDKNPYVPTNYLQAYPMYIAPEFSKYYTSPLRGSQEALNKYGLLKENSNVRGISNLQPAMESNYMISRGYNMLGGGQEAMQNYPTYPFMNTTQAYQNDYYYTNQNLDLGDVYNDTKAFTDRKTINEKFSKTVNPKIGYRDPECMRQNIECGSKNLQVQYPIIPSYGVRKCGCFS